MSNVLLVFALLFLAAILIGNLYILCEIYKIQVRIDNKLIMTYIIDEFEEDDGK